MIDVEKFIAGLHDYMERQFAPLIERIKSLENRPTEKGEPGKEGKSVGIDEVLPSILSEIERQVGDIPSPQDGKDGASVTIEDATPMIKEIVGDVVAEIPPAEDGKPGSDGKGVDLTDVELMVAEQLSKALESIEIPKDGDHGRDAVAIDVLPAIDFEKSYPRGTFATHKGGLWRAHANTDSDHGWECVVRGESELNVTMDGPRTFVICATDTKGRTKESRFTLPIWLYKNVWKDGESYNQGDVVTWGGSLWHCDMDTKDKPTDNCDAWTLCAKKGRDGKR